MDLDNLMAIEIIIANMTDEQYNTSIQSRIELRQELEKSSFSSYDRIVL